MLTEQMIDAENAAAIALEKEIESRKNRKQTPAVVKNTARDNQIYKMEKVFFSREYL